jgi:hypothetical protein
VIRAAALSLQDRAQVIADPDATGQGGIGNPIQGLCEARVAHQPDGQQIPRIEGEVEEGREIAEEVRGEVLGLVQDPDG